MGGILLLFILHVILSHKPHILFISKCVAFGGNLAEEASHSRLLWMRFPPKLCGLGLSSAVGASTSIEVLVQILKYLGSDTIQWHNDN